MSTLQDSECKRLMCPCRLNSACPVLEGFVKQNLCILHVYRNEASIIRKGSRPVKWCNGIAPSSCGSSSELLNQHGFLLQLELSRWAITSCCSLCFLQRTDRHVCVWTELRCKGQIVYSFSFVPETARLRCAFQGERRPFNVVSRFMQQCDAIQIE